MKIELPHASGDNLVTSALPEPEAAALAVSRNLTEKIRDEIERGRGSIDFWRYMEMALYEPGLGYYSAGARKFGRAGDFITAPELSPLFSRCLAVQCVEILQSLSGGCILEPGAGSGVMACDLLAELERRGSLPDKYYILETSADLKERQQASVRNRVPHLLDRVEWLERLPSEPFRGLIVANEVLDAIPVQRLYYSGGRLYQCGVGRDGQGFHWVTREGDAGFADMAGSIHARYGNHWPDPYITEFNPQLRAWIHSLGGLLQTGVILLLDYGYPQHEYYHPQRAAGTLLCHYRHRVHDDPFYHPGLQDITASVDFTAVAEAAVENGLSVRGFTTQAFFLMACDLEAIMQAGTGDDAAGQIEPGRQARVLTMPGEMGERIKVMALGKEFDSPLKGFQLSDQRRRL